APCAAGMRGRDRRSGARLRQRLLPGDGDPGLCTDRGARPVRERRGAAAPWPRVAVPSPGSARPHRGGIVSASPSPAIHCSNCEAVCCRLTVVVMPGDDVPAYMVERNENGPDVMARAEDGWCVALDRSNMRCGIYQTRPDVCRRFVM